MPSSEPWRPRQLYSQAAGALLGGLLLFALANALAAIAVFVFFPREGGTPVERYGLERLRRVYAGRGQDEIASVLAETWHRRQLEYHPFAQFRSASVRGRYVNVSDPGFRHVAEQRPWPPPAEVSPILFFGGSTAFGLGVSDEETIASRLQTRLETQLASSAGRMGVYNFGTPAHFSLQEGALLQSLLVAGIRPKFVVFLDGLNEFAYPGEPEWTTQLRAATAGTVSCPLADSMPLLRLAREFRHRQHRRSAQVDQKALTEFVTKRWGLNANSIRALAREFAFETLFVWQPVPTYGYDLTNHALYDGTEEFFGPHGLSLTGYPLAKARHDEGQLGDDVLWLAEIQRGRAENFYVDQCHYTAAFSAEIADRMAAAMAPRLER